MTLYHGKDCDDGNYHNNPFYDGEYYRKGEFQQGADNQEAENQPDGNDDFFSNKLGQQPAETCNDCKANCEFDTEGY